MIAVQVYVTLFIMPQWETPDLWRLYYQGVPGINLIEQVTREELEESALK